MASASEVSGHRVRFGDERRAVRADGDAHQQETDQRRRPQAVREGRDGDRQADDEGEVAEYVEVVHGRGRRGAPSAGGR